MAGSDLHIHTNVSDGVYAPAAVTGLAVQAGLSLFAIADHNSLAGLEEAERALPAAGLRLVFGVELSAQPEEGQEIHILGYGVVPGHERLQEVCRRINRRKREQFQQMVDLLKQWGVTVDLNAVLAEIEGDGYVGRPKLAELLVRNGVVKTHGQAVGRFIGRGGPAYVQMREFDPRLCIEAVHQAGGVAVLAHPTVETVDRWVARLVEMGLDGVEALRPALQGNEQLYVEKAAEHFRLMITGGSDWHGREWEPPLGAFAVEEEHIARFVREMELRGAWRSGAGSGSAARGRASNG